MPFMVTQASSVMMSSPSPINGAQDLHEHFQCTGDAAFSGLSNQNELRQVGQTIQCTLLHLRMLCIFTYVGGPRNEP